MATRAKIQLKTPIYAGMAYNQIAGWFESDDSNGNIWIQSPIGILLFNRDEIVYTVFIPEDADIEWMRDDTNILVLE